MSRDSHATHLHLTDSHYALYISNWVHDKLPNEEIEAPGLQIDDEDETSSIQQTTFGSIKSHRKSKPAAWRDLGLQKFIDDDFSQLSEIEDKTILKKLENLHQMDSDVSDQADTSMGNTGSNQETNRAANLPTFEISTPDVRNRTSQRNLQNYQTPIGRIMR